VLDAAHACVDGIVSPLNTQYTGAMPAQHVSTLPVFSNQRGCRRCGARSGVWVIFDRDCPEVIGGAHYHRVCSRCACRWIEQASETGRPEFE
jgi:hypothetical protein